ncbi:MAG: hypothetical protein COS90_07245 [Deltaproteobacteria bacterium CG07_land_8_20_14_0_80_60_11]|nr:MAG: hypothetical protein COS90_07245 [Deltaproteobacteria bacterium CG07_land_8_20_14_0_80_60_11]
MLTEIGQSLDWTPEAPELITAILPHPIHGRLVERVLLMVNKNITMEGMRYTLSWRDHELAFYRPITAH